jgi:hypothetical protein
VRADQVRGSCPASYRPPLAVLIAQQGLAKLLWANEFG